MDIIFSNKEGDFDAFSIFIKKMEKKLGKPLISIRSDHGIDHNFSASRTPQQNSVVERKNRTLEDMSRTMMIAGNIAKYLLAEAISTACYIANRCMSRPLLDKTPYELLKGRKANIFI